MKKVIVISGPINAGKSTVGRKLSRLLSKSVFLEGDEPGIHDVALFQGKVERSLQRIERKILTSPLDYLVIAFPLQTDTYSRLRLACHRRETDLLVITLCPPLELALENRGGRELTEAERRRIVQMYDEGYTTSLFSDLFFDNSRFPARETAAFLARRIAPTI